MRKKRGGGGESFLFEPHVSLPRHNVISESNLLILATDPQHFHRDYQFFFFPKTCRRDYIITFPKKKFYIITILSLQLLLVIVDQKCMIFLVYFK